MAARSGDGIARLPPAARFPLTVEAAGSILLAGLLQGGVYALCGVGLSLSLGLLGGVNLVHGEWVMLGAFCTWLSAGWGAPLPVAVVLGSIPVAGIALAAYLLLLRRAFVAPAKDRTRSTLLATLGLAFLLQEGASGVSSQPLWSLRLGSDAIRIGSVSFSSARLAVAGSLAALCTILWLVLKHTNTGMAVRAAVADRKAALLSGIRIDRLQPGVFCATAGIAGLAGGFLVLLFSGWPRMGLPITLKCFFLVILGAPGSLAAPLCGGLLMGCAEAATGALAGGRWSQAVALVLLLAAVVVRDRRARR